MARQGLVAAIAAAMAFTGGAAAAQSLVDGSDPQAILDLARGFGSAALETDAVGDPLLQGRIEGNVYSVYFYGCEKNVSCDKVLFSATWDVDSSSLEAVNDFNKNAVFGRAYIDDQGDYVIEMTVNLAHGVSRANLDDTFVVWSDVMRDFADFAATN